MQYNWVWVRKIKWSLSKLVTIFHWHTVRHVKSSTVNMKNFTRNFVDMQMHLKWLKKMALNLQNKRTKNDEISVNWFLKKKFIFFWQFSVLFHYEFIFDPFWRCSFIGLSTTIEIAMTMSTMNVNFTYIYEQRIKLENHLQKKLYHVLNGKTFYWNEWIR